MPSALRYVPPTESSERYSLSSAAEIERQRRHRRYRTALKYYMGEHDQQLEYEEDEPDDNTQINLVKMTADRTVHFLFPEVPHLSVDSGTEPTNEERWLREMLDFNGGLQFLTKLALRGFLSGHNFVRVKPPRPQDINTRWAYPRLVTLDPSNVTVFWKADDVGDILWYENRYQVGAQSVIQDYVWSNEENMWVIYEYRNNVPKEGFIGEIPTNHGRSNSPITLNESLFYRNGGFDRVNRFAHTSRIPPIVEFPHLPHPDDYYGLDEFNQKDLQDSINRIASERNRIVREHSNPVDVLLNADAEDIRGSGDFYSVSGNNTKVQRLQLSGDLSGISTTLDKLTETYLAIARVVLLKGEAKDLQRVTNASVRTLFLDALAKNKVLRESYGQGLAQIGHLALEMAYKDNIISTNPANLRVSTQFSEPLPSDDTEIANINQLGLAGKYLTPRQAAVRAGNDWEEVDEFYGHSKNKPADMEIEDANPQGDIQSNDQR